MKCSNDAHRCVIIDLFPLICNLFAINLVSGVVTTMHELPGHHNSEPTLSRAHKL